MFPDYFRDDVFRLETQRLWLRWPTAADAATIEKLAGEHEIAQFTARIPHPYPKGAAEGFVLAARKANCDGAALHLALALRQKPGVAIGMVSLEDGGSMSTRKGNIVALEDVINACIKKADAVIEAKNPELENRKAAARDVGLGAAVFSALTSNRIKDIVFSYDRILSFDGETAPYVQYTYARCKSVLSKADFDLAAADFSELTAEEHALLGGLREFPDTLLAAAEKYEPSFVTRLMVDIAKAYNKFYFECRILGEEEGVTQKRLALTACTATVLKTGFSLLGINMPEKM